MTYRQQHSPSFGVALSYPAAQHALSRMRRFWCRLATISGIVGLCFLGAILLGVVVGVVVGGEAAGRVVGVVGILGFLGAFVSGILAMMSFLTLQKTDRIEGVMRHFPWVERHQYRVRAGRYVTVLIGADQHGPETRCFATGGLGWPSIDRIRAGTGHQPLLVAGDPRREAVITTPAMQDLYLVHPRAFRI